MEFFSPKFGILKPTFSVEKIFDNFLTVKNLWFVTAPITICPLATASESYQNSFKSNLLSAKSPTSSMYVLLLLNEIPWLPGTCCEGRDCWQLNSTTVPVLFGSCNITFAEQSTRHFQCVSLSVRHSVTVRAQGCRWAAVYIVAVSFIAMQH